MPVLLRVLSCVRGQLAFAGPVCVCTGSVHQGDGGPGDVSLIAGSNRAPVPLSWVSVLWWETGAFPVLLRHGCVRV